MSSIDPIFYNYYKTPHFLYEQLYHSPYALRERIILPLIPVTVLRLGYTEHDKLYYLSSRIDDYYNDLTLSYQKENFGEKSIKTKIQELPNITNSKKSPNQYISSEDFLAYIICKLPEIEDKFRYDIDFTLKRILCKHDIRSFCNIATISNIKSYLLFAEKYGIEIARIAVQYPEIVFAKEILEDKLNLIPDITYLICMNLGNNHDSVKELLIGISGDITPAECFEQ